jgi:hypothetical protein
MRTGSTALLALLVLAGCDGAATRDNAAVPPAATATPQAAETPEPAGGMLNATDTPTPAATSPAGDSGDTMTIDDTAQGAANVIRHYYADLDRGDFRAAYERWGNGGKDSRQSFADFKRGFAETASTSVEIDGRGEGGGAAGSVYIDVPVTVHARLKDGTAQTFTGHYTLRRVNDVPGSTQAQRRWHLYSAELKAK